MICLGTLMLNLTVFQWNDFDREKLTFNTKRCMEVYNLPCAKTFIKTGEKDYRIICGEKVED